MSPTCRYRSSPIGCVPYLSEYQMDLHDLKPPVRVQDRYGYVYHTLFTRPTDGKEFHYIGQHKRTQESSTYKGSGIRLTALLNKYGRTCATTFVVSWAVSSRELDEKEKWFIQEARRLWKTDCINLHNGGTGCKGHPLARRARISLANRGRKHTLEARLKISKAHLGMRRGPLSDVHRAKLRAIQAQRNWFRLHLFGGPKPRATQATRDCVRWALWILGHAAKPGKAVLKRIGLYTLKWGNTGNRHSEATKAKLRAAWVRRRARGDIGTNTGKSGWQWYHNDQRAFQLYPDDPRTKELRPGRRPK